MAKWRTERVRLDNGNTYDIPVDEDGYVPTSALLKRFNNPRQGVKPGRKSRNLVQDYDDYADIVLPEKVTPQQAVAWWDCPANLDIEGIDTPGKAKDRKGIKIYGTEGEATKISQMIDATMSERERELAKEKGIVYSARPLKVGIKGLYRPSNGSIELDRRLGLEHQTVAHESAHMLRDKDGTRKGILITTNEALNVEESCTVAEQMARSRAGDYNGYYERVPVFDEKTRRWRNPTWEEAKAMADEDYMTLTYGRGKPLKEKDALESVNRNWSDTHISRLRYRSNRMAINSIAMQDSSFRPKADEFVAKTKGTAPKARRPSDDRSGKKGGCKAKQTKLFNISKKKNVIYDNRSPTKSVNRRR